MDDKQIYKIVSYTCSAGMTTADSVESASAVDSVLKEGWQIIDVMAVPLQHCVVVTVVMVKSSSGMLVYKHFEKPKG